MIPKALAASTSRSPHPFLNQTQKCSENTSIEPSMPDFNPEQIWSAPQTCWTSSPTTSIMTFAQNLSIKSPTPIGRTPGLLLEQLNVYLSGLSFHCTININCKSSHWWCYSFSLIQNQIYEANLSTIGNQFHLAQQTQIKIKHFATCSAVIST